MGSLSNGLDYREPDWVADRLGLDKNTIYKFLQDGTIPAIQLGRKWLISEARLAEWMSRETDAQTRARREATGSEDRTVQRLDNLTAGARRAVKQAHSEARRYNHAQLGQEHLLLGLATDARSRSARILNAMSVDVAMVRKLIEAAAPPGTSTVPRRLGRTAEAKKAMRLAASLAERESAAGAETRVATNHLLMGILLSRTGIGYEILRKQNITRHSLAEAIGRLMAGDHSQGETDGR